ncbi:NADP-dependent oxidoreductase [Agrococcus sp. ARC_14]|uniref:NADP-dependent oxidoreductase n=1 Tax=Agrococcus sp. ARC_14 TaxID=2919927 RepID=UPI001F050A67|nr:NADP-dependent oxidoreductase [Agrococcus sp. ARC_14]MCH1882075.1 NADP-dependent oxidoreductase [Agrococcus sp. ARC_14]
MSRFVQQQRFGGPEQLEVVERDAPDPGPGQVRVRVAAAGLNPVDWKIGQSQQLAHVFGVTLPGGFGNDFAGTIDALGDGVLDWAVGDRVFGGRRGAAVADHVVAEAASLTRTPDGLDDEVAGSLQIAARTADAAVGAVAPLPGETVVIGGAAGGVGVLATQLAVASGARVLATASESNHDFLRELGAEPVAYGEGLVERLRAAAPEGLAAAVDLHGTTTIDAALELGVAPQRISAIAAGADAPAGVRRIGGGDASVGALGRIAAALADGSVVLPIERSFPIERIREAVELQRGGHVRGKVVVSMR